jgi:hypothetical protein
MDRSYGLRGDGIVRTMPVRGFVPRANPSPRSIQGSPELRSHGMATFYVLPPRVCLEEHVTNLLKKLLPGLPMPVDAWDAIAERLASISAWPDDVYLVPRDEIPFGETVADALRDYFGAEPGDRVVEVNAAGSRSWSLPGVSALALAR